MQRPKFRLKKASVIVGRDRLTWRSFGHRLSLFHGASRRPLVSIESDSKYPSLFRIRYPSGELSDTVNLSRAKEAAWAFALRSLNSEVQESRPGGLQARQKARRVSDRAVHSSSAPKPSYRRSSARGRDKHKKARKRQAEQTSIIRTAVDRYA
jgi:hypothetical protein